MTKSKLIDKYEQMKLNARQDLKEAKAAGDEEAIREARSDLVLIRTFYNDLRCMDE